MVEFLKDDYTYLAVEIVQGQIIHYALLEIPSDKVPRFVILPTETKRTGSAVRRCFNVDDIISSKLDSISFDPSVISIKINIYRVAKDSRIIDSMIHAAHNGKRVTVVVELQARFDEAANIHWAKRLTEAGVYASF